MARHIGGFVHALDRRQVDLVGFSLAGYVASAPLVDHQAGRDAEWQMGVSVEKSAGARVRVVQARHDHPVATPPNLSHGNRRRQEDVPVAVEVRGWRSGDQLTVASVAAGSVGVVMERLARSAVTCRSTATARPARWR
jgi:hypothetical protein